MSKKRRNKKYKPRPKTNPVSKALLWQTANDIFLDQQLMAALAEDGKPAVGLMCHLGKAFGIAAIILLNTEGTSARFRQMHSMLRTVVGIAVSGCIWRSELEDVFVDALHDAHVLTVENPELAFKAWPDAQHLVSRIRSGNVRLDDVKGVELYRNEVVV